MKNIRILFVDDESDILDQGEIFLEREEKRFDITTSLSASQALDLLDENDFDVIISDYQMPDIDGLEFLEEIRKERNSDIPFIMFTGRGREEVAIKALNLGANRYIQKGGDPGSQYGVLSDAILQETEHHRTRISLRRKNKLLAHIFEKSEEGFYIREPSGKFTFVNRSFADIHGYSPEEMIGKNSRDFLTEECKKKMKGVDPDDIKDRWLKVTIKTKGGEKRILRNAVFSLKDDDGKVQDIFGITSDITEKKKAEELAREMYSLRSAIRQINQLIVQEDDLTELLQKTCETMLDIRQYLDVSIAIKREDDKIVPVAHCGDHIRERWSETFDGEADEENPTCVREAIQTREIKVIDDVNSQCENCEYCEYDEEHKSIIVPMVKNGKVNGILSACLPGEQEVTEEEIELLKEVSSDLAFAREKIMAEKRIEESEERYRRLFETAQDGMLIIDANSGKIKDANPYILEHLGYSIDELKGKKLWEIGTFKGIAENKKRFQELVDEGYIRYEDLPLKTNRGEEVPVEFVSNTYEAGGDKVVQCNIRDITQRRNIKDELKESQKDIKALYDLSSKLQNCKTEEDVFQIAISAVDEIFKFDVAGILIEEDGKGIVKASTSNIQEEIGDTVDINKGVVGLSFSEKKAFLIEDIRDFESVEPKSKKYRSGITIPIGDYGVFQALSKTVGYFDESDLEIAKLFISHLKEALDRLKREKIVQEKKNRIKKLHDVAARIELCQTKDEVYSLGIEAAENILDFDICVFDAVEGDKFVTKAVSSNVPVNGSLDRPIDDGGLDKKTYREQRSYIVDDLIQNDDSKPVKDEYRSAISVPIGKGGIFQAVSKEPNQFDEEDLELAELLINHVTEALKRVEMSEREQFLHTLLRHDVGNKIQIIQGYIYLLEADFDLPEKAEDYLQRAKKGIIGSIELIDKVRVLRRTKEEDIKKLDIRPMINETVNDLKDVSEEKGFELTVNIPDDISDVQGGSLLKEVFSNIIENSIKFSEGSLIKITCEESDDRVVCKIEDDGIGIPDEKKDDIFSKGYTSDMERGTGLGLYLVELLLNRYGGKVTVKDSKLGGTRFDIELKKAENS